jgi:prepilin-type N-terminal cleavage/methylation domain-containing protein
MGGDVVKTPNNKIISPAKNNKGFTLVEMMVSIAILGIISVSLMTLVTSSMEYYRQVSNRVNLQYEYQIVMTQLREYSVNCNRALLFDDTDPTGAGNRSLYFLGSVWEPPPSGGPDAEQLILHVFDFTPGNTTLTYSAFNFGTPDSPTDAADVWAAPPRVQPSPLSENIRNFNIDDVNANRHRLVVTMTFFQDTGSRERSYTGAQAIALRNGPLEGGSIGNPAVPGATLRTNEEFLQDVVNERHP